jgi:thioredoxin-like negative regulator of GroEL
MANTNLLIDSINPTWPDSPARAYLLSLVGQQDGISKAHRLLTDYGSALNEARLHLDAGDFNLALGATSIAVLRWSHDATAFFYAAETMLALGEIDDARSLLGESAKRASPKQAREGRQTLREFGERIELAPELIEEMRDILGDVLEKLGLDPDVAEDDAPGEAGDEQDGNGA